MGEKTFFSSSSFPRGLFFFNSTIRRPHERQARQRPNLSQHDKFRRCVYLAFAFFNEPQKREDDFCWEPNSKSAMSSGGQTRRRRCRRCRRRRRRRPNSFFPSPVRPCNVLMAMNREEERNGCRGKGVAGGVRCNFKMGIRGRGVGGKKGGGTM